MWADRPPSPASRIVDRPSLLLPLANSLYSHALAIFDGVTLAAPGSAGQSTSGITCLEPEGIAPRGRRKCLGRTCSNGARAGFGSRAARVARRACRPEAAQPPTYRRPAGNGHHLGFLKEAVRPFAVSPCPPLPSAVEAVTHSKSHSALLLRPPLMAAEKPRAMFASPPLTAAIGPLAIFPRPPLTEALSPLAVFPLPPLTAVALPLAVLSNPPPMEAVGPLARLKIPPLTEALSPLAVLSNPPLTDANAP
jgi:hypothetical protein